MRVRDGVKHSPLVKRKGCAVRDALIIDDNPDYGYFLVSLLARHGIQARLETDGRQALKVLASGEYGLVVTDLMMPHIDGIEVVRAVCMRHPDLTIVAISGSACKIRDVLHRALLCFGAIAVLAKHVDEDRLIEIALASCGG